MAVGYGKRVRRLLVDWVVGKAPTAPAAWYIGMSTANPGDAGAGIAEPSIGTGSYARSTSLNGASNWTSAPDPSADAAAVSANSTTCSFTASSAAWSTTTTPLTHFFMSDSTTATTEATYIGRGALTPSTTTVNGSGVTLTFSTGNLSFTCIST